MPAECVDAGIRADWCCPSRKPCGRSLRSAGAGEHVKRGRRTSYVLDMDVSQSRAQTGALCCSSASANMKAATFFRAVSGSKPMARQ